MARSKNTSPAEDLLFLVAPLPWWAGTGLAVAATGAPSMVAETVADMAVLLGYSGHRSGACGMDCRSCHRLRGESIMHRAYIKFKREIWL